MRPGYQAEMQPDGSRHSQAYLKAKKQLEEDSPIPILKRFISDSIFTQKFYWFWAIVALLADAVITSIIIITVKYTEIDYSTYMQQVSLFLKGERDYSNITGNTGPCVYPAMHLYLYSFLHWLTEGGKNLINAQIFFAFIYLLTQFFVMGIYKSAGAPSGIFPFFLLSKRLHSIYVLRLFNDPLAMFLFYLGVWLLCFKKWKLACVFYSLALGVKMNILLFAPALIVILFRQGGISRMISGGIRILSVQLFIALPFISTPKNFKSYLSSSFDLSRIFLYKWSVNWKFIDEINFLSKEFSKTLLIGHLSFLIFFGFTRWTGLSKNKNRLNGGGLNWLKKRWSGPHSRNGNGFLKSKINEDVDDDVDEDEGLRVVREPSGKYIAITLFTSNLIGMTFSRSLHYQFFSWYSQQIPLLIWSCRKRYHSDQKSRSIFSFFDLALYFILIEYSWNVYPATQFSSLTLFITHLSLLFYLWFSKSGDSEEDEKEVFKIQKQWEKSLEGKEI